MCLVFEQTVLAAVTRVLSERVRVFTISPVEERAKGEGERSPPWNSSRRGVQLTKTSNVVAKQIFNALNTFSARAKFCARCA